MQLEELLATPVLGAGTLVAPGDPRAPVRELHVGETAADVSGASPDSVLVLTRSGASGVRSFRLDVLMARAARAGVRLIVLPCAVTLLPRPHQGLAAEVGVLALDPDEPFGPLVVALARRLASQDSALVQRMRDASEALGRLDAQGGADGTALESGLVAILATAGMSVELADLSHPVPAGHVCVPADDGRQWVAGTQTLPPDAVRLLLHTANSRLLAAQTESAMPDRTLSALVSEILSDDGTLARELRFRAQTLGFRVDGWHLVLALDAHVGADGSPDIHRVRMEQTVRRVAVQELHAESAGWSWTHRGSSLLFVRTWSRQPTQEQLAAAVDASHAAFAAVQQSLGQAVQVFAGCSSAHQHLDGLKRAGSEARSAARDAHNRSARSVVAFDRFGLEEVLVDWYLSDSASSAAAARLAPITSLPPSKSGPLLDTLRVYLDHQGSIALTAEALFMHRNAVRYRIDRVKSLLGTDLSDPDERLSLHLACRGWALTAGGRSRTRPASAGQMARP